MLSRTVFLVGFKFMLMTSDEYTEKYMEDNSTVFPEVSLQSIINKIKAPAKNYPSLQAYAIDLLKRFDKNGNKFVDINEFANGLRSMKIHITNAEEHAIFRRFDKNNDNKISMEELYNVLAQNF